MSDDVAYRAFLNRDRLVSILDGDPATCEALSVLFRLEGFQTICAHEVRDFVSAFEQRRPDAVMLNLEVAGADMMPLLTSIKEKRTGIPVFMLADQPDVERTVEAMRAGASGVFAKPIAAEKLAMAVREVLRRDVHVLASNAGAPKVEIRGFNQLTPREREVLQLITNGRSNKEAGRELGISGRTVEVHRASIKEKLGARNTADLIRIVLTS